MLPFYSVGANMPRLPPSFDVVLPRAVACEIPTDSKFQLEESIRSWLDEKNCWSGLDPLLFDYNLIDLAPLRRWDLFERYAVFAWNHETVGKEFKKEFSLWEPDMVHKVETNLSAEDHIASITWLANRDLHVAEDFCYSAKLPDLKGKLFEFVSKDAAMLFKLAWGGHL